MPSESKQTEQWSPDKEWAPEQWRGLLEQLIQKGLVTWNEVTALVLGQLNPPQVGTSLASNKRVQAHLPPKGAWQAVRKWLYEQPGYCEDCYTRLDLQVDHIVPREEGGSDTLDNFEIRCRRCNVCRRPSHKKGKITFLSAEAALMWLLFVYKPATYEEYRQLCRKYGLTMADIRFQEAWAMAEWLKRQGQYP